MRLWLLALVVLWTASATAAPRKPILLFWCRDPERTALRATFVTPQVWTADDQRNAEYYQRRPDYEQSAWLKRGVTPLRWMDYEHEKSEAELVEGWASAVKQGYVGIAIDEIGHVNAETDAKAARALIAVKKKHPDLFIAVWHAGGLTPELLNGYRDGVDLLLLETYGVPFNMERYKAWISDRIAVTRKAGIIHKTVIALGINDAAKPDEWAKVGQWVNTRESLEPLLKLIHQQAPEMKGAAFFAPRASEAMLRAAEELTHSIFGQSDAIHNTFADYDAELRKPDGRVDVDALAAQLKELGVDTYYWLIWHAPTDWEDLNLFLPKARQAGINVWVYLVPPSESPPNTTLYSEPFRLDYKRWAEETAKLSLEHKNLTAWVIDDFYANRQFFTPAYIREMQARAKRINPRLAFLPLMYYGEIRRKFVDDYREVIDGVVAAYPQNRDEIERAWAFLNDAAVTVPGEISYPWGAPSQAGDFAMISQTARVTPTDKYQIRFRERDDFTAETSGYHFKQLLVDGEVVWEEDVAGGTPAEREITVDVTKQVRSKQAVTLSFRMLDKKGVSNFGVRWLLRDLKVEGLQLSADLTEPQKWQVQARGVFETGFGAAPQKAEGRFHVPFIVMTAGQPVEFRLRHGDPATPDRIAEWLRMCLQAWRDGKCDGVVTYCLDKGRESKTFERARKLLREFEGK